MDSLLIFNKLNDLVFRKYNDDFEEYIRKYAISQDLISEGGPETDISNNVFIQIFSPVVTSHRIMHCQFGNSYTSVQFQDDLKITFAEFMGYLFLSISNENITGFVQKCVVFARYICGPDISQLQSDESKSDLLCNLIDQWLLLRSNSQTVYVEAIEQLVVNSDITATCLETLKNSANDLVDHSEYSKVHAILMVEDKILSLYSSVNAHQLSPTDLLFIVILTHCQINSNSLNSQQVLLTGNEEEPKCLPHVIHTVPLFERVYLIYVIEIGHAAVSATLYENFCHLHALQNIQVQRDKEKIQFGFENVELAVKRLNDSIKKVKDGSIESVHKQITKQWEIIKTKYKEYLKSGLNEAILRAETLLPGMLDELYDLFRLISKDSTILDSSFRKVSQVLPRVKSDLEVFTDFFKVKGTKNFTLGSYMEDFPGLVHFLYVDRNTHRVTTPTLDLTTDKADFMKKKIWLMISFGQRHLQQGYTSIIWKDTTFTYGYFLWFENHSGGPIKTPTNLGPMNHNPGILEDDYFLRLKKTYFPKQSPSKIKCYELFCVHLGLTTPSGMLEQARRLAGTVWELKGFPTHAIDFL
ncbi:Hermansky-Pudlak syndrome 1 protein homolog isoform X2 [Sitophilus oryzae]|uniref:Hermansky-Pudlak syndrome 1 protein homolog isoform X2 n=1 Tax=Sitophilus oryzae TaxID=7048 RepID=A0A6J2Y0J4_SITOR|nr:Hermansky-Pudlak syndrome 1 protein homolog isoform X2 [Sitophilus oryzae]